jgi:hypothetical protein
MEYVIGWACSTDKGKVVAVGFLTEYHAMKAYWGSGNITPHIL